MGMAGRKEKLTARAAATSKPGRYGDGGGLWLVVSRSGARKWVYRFTFGGKVTEMGLGSAAVMSLAQARDKASAARKVLAAGQNPIEARRNAAKIEAGKPTFGFIANAFIAAKEGEWRNEKHRAQWRITLEKYAASLSSRPVPRPIANRPQRRNSATLMALLPPILTARPHPRIQSHSAQPQPSSLRSQRTRSLS
jgi:hypothetical protein